MPVFRIELDPMEAANWIAAAIIIAAILRALLDGAKRYRPKNQDEANIDLGTGLD